MTAKPPRLSPVQLRFWESYVKTGRVGESYKIATGRQNLSDDIASARGSAILKQKAVAKLFAELHKKTVERNLKTVEGILETFADIASADPSELMQLRRLNCRHCHGKKHLFQWVDQQEFANALGVAMDRNAQAKARKKPQEVLPDDAGGYGYHRHRAPNPNCPKCFGDGIVDVYFADTRTLSPQARRVFAGIKQTKDGLEVKLRDMDKALESLARIHGMFKDRVQVDPPEPEKPAKPVEVPKDPQEAARFYQAFMTRAGKK